MSQSRTISLKNSRLKAIGLVLSFLIFSPLSAEQNSFLQNIDAFIGKGLNGWKIPKGNDVSKWYQVNDSILKVRSGPKKKGSILWTEKEYRDFEVNFEFRFIKGTIDSGILLRNLDQIQIGISGSLQRDMTCSPFIPGKGYPLEANRIKSLLELKNWNEVKIRAIGPKYSVWLQGEEVMQYKSSTAKEKGPIGIQLHSNRNMAIDFKSFTIKEL